ncbi:sensor histidine kinase [Aquibacillus koreensis]|uniref:histidine kinase n=1 Tax=Aquibacillus koreensis TaxID=279446 RepID=A0A9X4AJ49_9BACI|nr:sensor histidine kinase [Aquibacillus koreensis]MCT2537054.1 sensor histidine kinase [Aquibacillus koreensis]MDC3419963.1 sensor histidine kinase [Aquibacillus koreensis]
MIWSYIKERRSWILLFLSLQGLLLFVSYLDNAIPFTSALYIVCLSLLIFFIFIIIRYQRETRFYKSLVEREDSLDLSQLDDPRSPFEQFVTDSLSLQTEHLKKEASEHWTLLEQEKDELLAWIHEVKTPLTTMHLIIERLNNDTMKANLTYEWMRIHLLLDQQLHQKRIPFIKNDLYMEETDVEDVIIQEIKTLQSWCIQKGIGFDMDLKSQKVLTDAKWVGFIIRQLLTNAVKYSRQSDIVIVSYVKDEQTVLEIKDVGLGIDAKDLPRIFEKGFTSTTRHQDHASTGMGLYLTKKVADALHISLDVTSKLGVGTSVRITFPKRNAFVALTRM